MNITLCSHGSILISKSKKSLKAEDSSSHHILLQGGRRNHPSRSSEKCSLRGRHIWLGRFLARQQYSEATRERNHAFNFIHIMHKNLEFVFFFFLVGKHFKSPIKLQRYHSALKNRRNSREFEELNEYTGNLFVHVPRVLTVNH